MALPEERLNEHEKRLLTLETLDKVTDGELMSLRASRHEFGNVLNRHSLEINELMLKGQNNNGQLVALLLKVGALEKDFTALQLSITTQLSTMAAEFTEQMTNANKEHEKNLAIVRSDLRQTMWAVSILMAIITFALRTFATKYGF